MKDIFNKYMNNTLKLDRYQKIAVIASLIVITGIFGWVYEVIFYYFNGGMKMFYMRGSNFLPWINIYAIGSFMIIILTHKFKNNRLFVFLIAFISTGILEYFSGYFLLKITGMRCWDYNTEILNFGNIDGFVCLRSVGFFGLSGLLLVYGFVPGLIWLSTKVNKKTYAIISVIICSIFLLDELYNLVFARILGTPRASSIYKNLGIPYMNYFDY